MAGRGRKRFLGIAAVGSLLQLFAWDLKHGYTSTSGVFRYRPEVAATTPTSGIDVESFHFLRHFFAGRRKVTSTILGRLVGVIDLCLSSRPPASGTFGSGDTEGQSFEVSIFVPGYRSDGSRLRNDISVYGSRCQGPANRGNRMSISHPVP